MIRDSIEIEIIKNANQPNIADPSRSEIPFINILNDFFSNFDFKQKKIMDLGPGHYDFFNLIDNTNKENLHAIDKDPAVIKLGKYRKYSVTEANLKNIHTKNNNKKFDLLFCKFSINAYWFYDDPLNHERYIDYLASMLNLNGSAWIAPWNGIPKTIDIKENQKKIMDTINKQICFFEKNKFKTLYPSPKEIKRYGLTGNIINNPIFIKNLF
jgi:hypothetical protein